jgi:hypothetical protein
MLEQAREFRPALLEPHLGIGYPSPIQHRQRIGQRSLNREIRWLGENRNLISGEAKMQRKTSQDCGAASHFLFEIDNPRAQSNRNRTSFGG